MRKATNCRSEVSVGNFLSGWYHSDQHCNFTSVGVRSVWGLFSHPGTQRRGVLGYDQVMTTHVGCLGVGLCGNVSLLSNGFRYFNANILKSGGKGGGGYSSIRDGVEHELIGLTVTCDGRCELISHA